MQVNESRAINASALLQHKEQQQVEPVLLQKEEKNAAADKESGINLNPEKAREKKAKKKKALRQEPPLNADQIKQRVKVLTSKLDGLKQRLKQADENQAKNILRQVKQLGAELKQVEEKQKKLQDDKKDDKPEVKKNGEKDIRPDVVDRPATAAKKTKAPKVNDGPDVDTKIKSLVSKVKKQVKDVLDDVKDKVKDEKTKDEVDEVKGKLDKGATESGLKTLGQELEQKIDKALDNQAGPKIKARV